MNHILVRRTTRTINVNHPLVVPILSKKHLSSSILAERSTTVGVVRESDLSADVEGDDVV